MNFTNFLRLKKPLREEKYLVSIVNENSDLIDKTFQEHDEKLNQNEENFADHMDDFTMHMTTLEKRKLENVENGAQVNTITGIKGDNESSFRTGNVNLTAENVGADSKGSALSALEQAKEYALSKDSVDVANGVAPLDEDRKIPSSNIPFGTTIDTVMNGAVGEEIKTDMNVLSDSVTKHIQNNDVHFTVEEREKLSGISNNANNYEHPKSTVVAGDYTKTTVNEYGHIISGSNPTTLEGYGIVNAESKGTADAVVSTHNSSTSSHNDIRILISELTTKLDNFLDVDDSTKDQLSEVLELIENNKDTLESITTNKVNVSDIINNLTTNVNNKPLSAAQGVALKALIDDLQETIDNSDLSIATSVQEHIDNSVIHITSEEKTKISNALNKTGDASNVTNTFTSTSSRTNLTTGEKLSVSLGKIMKWFSDLKTVAFSGSYNDLSDKPTTPNSFGNVKVGETTISADTTTDTLELVAGNNVTITPDESSNKITISSSVDVVDNLESTATDLPLSANQGKVLNDAISTINSNLNMKMLDGVDILTITEKGDYYVANPINSPTTLAGYLSVFPNQDPEYATTYRTIRWTSYNKTELYINTCNNGVWKGWEKVATNSDLAGYKLYPFSGQYTPDAEGRIEIAPNLGTISGFAFATAQENRNCVFSIVVCAYNKIIIYASKITDGSPYTETITANGMLFYR